jgi:alkylated DNA repair dioxygenase AlkB
MTAEPLAEGAVVLRQLATPVATAMTNCGLLGWVTDPTGYRDDAVDPETGDTWPPMPDVFQRLAEDAAARGGFSGFAPDACLINRYEQGARLSLHPDAGTSRTSGSRSCPCRWDCRQCSCSADCRDPRSRAEWR